MRVVREILPEGMPFVFQAITDDNNDLQSVAVYPIHNGKVLEALPDTGSAIHLAATIRLATISKENN
jgi:hypothetical protein